MNTTDYVIAAILVLLVVPQIRGMRLTVRSILLPIVAVAAAAVYYLKSVPTQGNDVVLDVLGVGAGLLLGIGCGLTTRLFRDAEGFMVAKAGLIAAALWIVGMASRTGFEYAATHSGAHAIADFSRSNSITGANAWTVALLLMALAQVLSRVATIRIRARLLSNGSNGGPAFARA